MILYIQIQFSQQKKEGQGQNKSRRLLLVLIRHFPENGKVSILKTFGKVISKLSNVITHSTVD